MTKHRFRVYCHWRDVFLSEDAVGSTRGRSANPPSHKAMADKPRMLDRRNTIMKTTGYEKPKVMTLDGEALMSALSPSLSCTGFGGSVSC